MPIATIIPPVAVWFVLTQDAGLTAKSLSLIGILFLVAGWSAGRLHADEHRCLVDDLLAAPVTLNAIGGKLERVNSFSPALIPMFVLMGAILVRSNASTEMFAGIAQNGDGPAARRAGTCLDPRLGHLCRRIGFEPRHRATMGRVAGQEMMREGDSRDWDTAYWQRAERSTSSSRPASR